MEPRLYTTDAPLYDLAFSWDATGEMGWLLARLGPDCAPVLEPACGSGRLLAALAQHGVEAVGLDSSPAMIALARRRLRNLAAQAVVGDMRSFALGRTFGGAICPIDSLAYLTEPAEVVDHLRCTARHLRPGSRYLIQLELRHADDPWAGVRPSEWEAERGGVRVRTRWEVEEIDLSTGIELARSRIEILSGEERGRVFEEVHRLAAWTPERWAATIAETPFAYEAVYDGDDPVRPRRPAGTAGRLLWHELSV